jgi:hypothetical protein
MLSIRRIAVTAAAAAALAAPAAQARPVDAPTSHDGFEWSDPALGGGTGAAVGFVLLIGGAAWTVRRPRAPVTSR